MVDSIHVRLAVSACDRCPVAVLSEETAVEDVRVAPSGDRVEFVADESPSDPPDPLEIVEFGGQIHGRYEFDEPTLATDGGATLSAAGSGDAAPQETEPLPSTAPCGDCSCGGFVDAFDDVPVSPRETRIEDGELLASFVLTGQDELESVVESFERAGLSVELRRLLVDDGDDEGVPDVVPIDLAGMTDRQLEIARVAAEHGYFDREGASAQEIADEFDLAKSTVSEHIRLVTDAVFSQLFTDGGS